VEEDPDFIDEFQNVVSDPEIPEEDESFSPNIFDDTYLNMEIALPRGSGDPEDVQYRGFKNSIISEYQDSVETP
jgi:hypothetical protein